MKLIIFPSTFNLSTTNLCFFFAGRKLLAQIMSSSSLNSRVTNKNVKLIKIQLLL